MSNLEYRIMKLERAKTGREPDWVILLPASVEVTREEIEEAKAAYKAKHPAWRFQDAVALPVGYEEDGPIIQMLDMLDRGEWPSKR